MKMRGSVSCLPWISRLRWYALGLLLFWVLCKPSVLLSISAYQRFISPHKGWCCAYAVLHGGPSCSAYGKEVISRHGVLGGTLLLWDRFGACRAAANILAVNSVGNQAGKECADSCVRGCCNGPPQGASPPRPVRPRPTPRPRPPAASITVTSPDNWADYDATGTYYPENPKVVKITWKSTGLSGSVNIDVSRNNVSLRKWDRILSDLPNTSQAQWTPTGAATPFARVRVQSTDRATVSGTNSADFCIYGPYYKGFPGGFCTEYAAREFDKISPGLDWHGDAGEWCDNAAANNWKVTTDPEKGEAGAIIVWTFGKYGHVAVLRGYQQEDETELQPTYPQDAKGNFVAVIDEQNAGEMIHNPITKLFGQVARRQLPASNFDRYNARKQLTLKFRGMILPSKNN
jgi:putative component of membrane protein insertase Oxa1/YidC/SpoIIIJ protein YidD